MRAGATSCTSLLDATAPMKWTPARERISCVLAPPLVVCSRACSQVPGPGLGEPAYLIWLTQPRPLFDPLLINLCTGSLQDDATTALHLIIAFGLWRI